MPQDHRPRWITITKVPYDYRWPDRSAMTSFSMPGEYFVKAELADHAVTKGYATEGKATDSPTRSRKGKTSGKKATKATKTAKPAADAEPPADTGSIASVGDAGAADAGGAADRPPVDRDAG
jgi:hypothetical protein